MTHAYCDPTAQELAVLSATGAGLRRTGRTGQVVGAVLLFLSGATSAAELPFDTGRVLTTSLTDGRIVVAADFDLDGVMDLMAAGDSAGVVWLWSGTGGGSFLRTTVASGLAAPTSLSVGDVDGDGDPDLVVGQSANVTGAGVGEVMWFANPTFGAGSTWTAHVAAAYTNNKVNDLACADIDQDGDLDIVVSRGVNDVGFDWLENDGTPASGSWPSHVIDADFSGLAFAVADLDGDGDPDIVSRIPAANAVYWWEHDGVPTDNWTAHEIDDGIGYFHDVACGDVTGDGRMDIVAAVPSTDDVYLFSRSGSSWITRQVATASANHPSSVQIVDMDFDGDQDILSAVLYADEVVWFENTDGAGTSWTSQVVSDAFDDAEHAVAADLDGDGDLDVAAVGLFSDRVAWFENRTIHREIAHADPLVVRDGLGEPRAVEIADVNGDGLQDMVVGEWDGDAITLYLGIDPAVTLWWEQPVATSFDRVRDVAVADMDSDGDLDIVGAALGSDQVWWWANDGTGFPSWTSHPILNGFNGAHMVSPADMDGDGDMDVVVAAYDGDEVAWVENLNSAGTSWTKYTIVAPDGPHDAVVGDFDDDGYPDIAYSAYNADHVKVLINPIGSADFWSTITVATGVDGPRGLDLADLDGDGDLDIAAAIRLDNQIAWYENNGSGLSWIAHPIGSGLLVDGAAVRLADLNHDGAVDVVASSQSQGDILVWRNGGDGSSWSSWRIEYSLPSPWAIAIADVDRNGWPDIAVAAGSSADSLSWYRHIGGQYRVQSWSTAPATIESGTKDDIVMLTLWHRGMAGADGEIRPANAVLHLADGGGQPLTTTQANQLIERLEVFADTDNNGLYTAGDTLVLSDTYLELVAGATVLDFGATSPAERIAPASSETFFVVLSAAAQAYNQTPHALRVTFVDAELEVEDVTWALPLTGTPGASTTTGLIELTQPFGFADGFESGDCSHWSSVIPSL